jgi:hypothetical protein
MADENFLSGLLGAPDNTNVDPNTGMTAAQRQQSIYGTFGNIGALLMAAGQKQMPAERAKYLAQIGQIPGQMQQQMTDAQKLLMQKQQFQSTQALQKQQITAAELKNTQAKAASEALNSPEFKAAYQNMAPEQRAAIDAAKAAGDYSSIIGYLEKLKPTMQNGLIINPRDNTATDPISGIKYDMNKGTIIEDQQQTGGAPAAPGAPTAPRAAVDLSKYNLPEGIKVNEDIFSKYPEAYRQRIAKIVSGDSTIAGLGRGNAQAMERLESNIVAAFPDFSKTTAEAMRNHVISLANHGNGKLGAYADSVGTMAEHYNTLAKTSEGIDNPPIMRWSAVKNKFEAETGNPKQTEFAVASNIYLSELAKVLKGGGVPTNADKEEVASMFNRNLSDNQLKGGLKLMNEMALARVHSVDSGTERTFGPFYNPDKHSVITPFAKQQFEKTKNNKWLYPDQTEEAATGNQGISGAKKGPKRINLQGEPL